MVHPSLKFGHIHNSLLSKCADRTKQNWNVAFCMSACTLFRSVCAPFRPGATLRQHRRNQKKQSLHLETIMIWRLCFAFSHFPGGPEVRMIHMQVCVNAHHSVIPNTDAECSAVVPEAFFHPA